LINDQLLNIKNENKHVLTSMRCSSN